METRRVFGTAVVIFAFGSLSVAVGGTSEPEFAEPVEIDSGFVIMEGRYMSPPYTLRAEAGKAYLNGFELSLARRGPFGSGGFGMRRMNPRQSVPPFERIEQHLRQDGLVVCSRGQPAGIVPVEQAIEIFDVLLADGPSDTKLQSLTQMLPPWSGKGSWALVADTFELPAELGARVEALKKAWSEPSAEGARMERHWTVMSGLTMTGFALAVWALGTLLSCRPPMRRGWRGVNPSRVCCRQVVWLVVLIVVLNQYDLLCTLLAHSAGSLWELNPFAYKLVDNTAVIAVFKIALTIGAASLLLAARRHRLAQIGSWWVGVLYTVLIVRWATFSSMFM